MATQRVVCAYGRMQDTDLYSTMPPHSLPDIPDDNPVQKRFSYTEPEDSSSDEDISPHSSGTIAASEDKEMPQRHIANDCAGIRAASDSDSATAEITPHKMSLRAKEIPDVPFYVSQQSAADADGVDDDLPDFEMMVAAKTPPQSMFSKGQTARKIVKGRRLVLDDSD